MLKNIVLTVIGLLLLLGSLYISYRFGVSHCSNQNEIIRDTTFVEILKRDTIILTDTKYYFKKDTLYLEGDSIPVIIDLPFELKTYKGNNYSLDISGYKTNLENIDIFLTEKVITEYRIETKLQPPTFAVSVNLGYKADNINSYPFVDATFKYNVNRFNFSTSLGYSPTLKAPLFEIKVGYDLFRIK